MTEVVVVVVESWVFLYYELRVLFNPLCAAAFPRRTLTGARGRWEESYHRCSWMIAKRLHCSIFSICVYFWHVHTKN